MQRATRTTGNITTETQLNLKWSPHNFADKPVEPEKMRPLFEAARWAPSHQNEQPWHFIVVQRQERPAFDRLVRCLREGDVRLTVTAPVLILAVARRYFENTGEENEFAAHDVGLALENMIIEAMAQGLAVHQLTGFDRKKAAIVSGIPDGDEPVAILALGYVRDKDLSPAEITQRDNLRRSRKPVADFVYAGQWGTAFHGHW